MYVKDYAKDIPPSIVPCAHRPPVSNAVCATDFHVLRSCAFLLRTRMSSPRHSLMSRNQPFSTRYSSPRLSLHHSKHHLLNQSIVLHPAHMCIMCIIYISLLYANSSRPCVSRISLRPPYS